MISMAAAIEAAAMEINKRHGYSMPPWDELVTSKDLANRNRVKLDREYARVALEAAAQYLCAGAEGARKDLYEIISHSFYNEFEDPTGHTADAIVAAGYRKVEL